jgi:vacuolar-type H+-ATPase subunit D/Vma8
LLIPRLEAERDYIQITLDERERTDHFRLKLEIGTKTCA